MNGLILGLVGLVIEAIGAITGGIGSYRVYSQNGDVITGVLMATFAVCCVLLGSITAKIMVFQRKEDNRDAQKREG